MRIIYSHKFVKEYKSLSKTVKLLAEEKEEVFKSDLYSPSLKTHKLTGKLKGYLSFSINYQYRIVFRFLKDKTVVFHSIGTHDIYK